MTTMALADVRANFSRIVDEAARTHERVEVTRNGVRAAVVLGADDFDALMETLDILADADEVRELRLALTEVGEGNHLTTAEVLDGLAPARRGDR